MMEEKVSGDQEKILPLESKRPVNFTGRRTLGCVE